MTLNLYYSCCAIPRQLQSSRRFKRFEPPRAIQSRQSTVCSRQVRDRQTRQGSTGYYASFAIKVTELLQRRGINVNVLILACSCLNEGDDLPCDICEANSIESLVQALQKYQTWYNYGILEFFATNFGEKEGEKLVKSYEARLKHNVERRVKTQEVPKEASKLVVKLNWINYVEQDIVNLRNMLAKVLKRDTREFVLKHVGKGCVELVYIIPSDLCESIRGLNLEEYGVISVTING